MSAFPIMRSKADGQQPTHLLPLKTTKDNVHLWDVADTKITQ